MPEVLTNPNQELPKYPIKRGAQRKGMGNLRPVKARLGAAGEAVVVDLSEGGIGLELAMPLQPGSTLAVDFDLPESGGHVRVDGRVIWSGQGRRAGIRFERIPDLTSERLKRWVSLGKQASKPSAAEASGPAPSVTVGDSLPVAAGDEAQALDRAVVQVLARAVAITKASGAAIAIGPPEAMVCRASTGNAPDVGVPINPSSGLTGYCVRNRATVVCDDTETDERVNAAACREMELRSALVIPVFSSTVSGDLSGILEVFSSQPKAFTPDHIAKLEKLTKILGIVVADLVPGNNASETVSAVAVVETSVEPETVAAPTVDLRQERAHLPRKIGERTQLSQTSAASTPAISNARPARATESGNGTPQKSEPVAQVKPALAAPVITSQIVAKETAVKLAELSKPAGAASMIALPIASPDGLSASESESAILSVPSFATTDQSLTERIQKFLAAGRNQRTRIGRALRVIGVIVIALEIAAAVFLYTRWQKKRTAVSESAHAVQTVPVAVPATPVTVPTAEVSVLQAPTPTPVFKRKAPAQNVVPDDGSDEVIVVNRSAETGAATASQAGVASSSPTKDIDPPVAPMEGRADLAAIHLPDNPVKPSLALRTSSGTFGGKLIKRVEPIYPDAAKTRGIRGQVLLNAHIGKDGAVKEVRVLKGNPFLGNAAVEAVKHWRYEPMKLNGYPVEMDTTVMVEFKLPN